MTPITVPAIAPTGGDEDGDVEAKDEGVEEEAVPPTILTCAPR
jgi:hypothetical protein